MNGGTELARRRPGASKGPARSFLFHRNATFVSLLIGYAGYYLCRQNLAAAYPAMKDVLHLDKATFGQIASFGTLVYCIGKFTTGALADTYGGRIIFFVGLVGVVLFSLVFGSGAGVTFFFVIWGVVRFFQSMGWGGLVNVMSRWFPSTQYGTAMGIMSINYQFGGVLATVFAGYLLTLGFGWRALFVVPALVLAVIGIAGWFFIKNSPRDVGYGLPVSGEAARAAGRKTVHDEDDSLTYMGRLKLALSDRAFLIMCALSFILTLLRESFGTWMPEYFSEMGASASMAAFKSAVFPFLGCLGTLFTGWFSDKYLQGRRAPIMAVLMLVLVFLLLALGHLDVIAHVVAVERSTVAVWLVAATGFFLLGPYSLVGGVVALDFGGRRTAGTAAGLLDGVGYAGGALAGWGVAEVLLKWGWAQAFTAMAALTLVAIGLCFFLWRVKPKE